MPEQLTRKYSVVEDVEYDATPASVSSSMMPTPLAGLGASRERFGRLWGRDGGGGNAMGEREEERFMKLKEEMRSYQELVARRVISSSSPRDLEALEARGRRIVNALGRLRERQMRRRRLSETSVRQEEENIQAVRAELERAKRLDEELQRELEEREYLIAKNRFKPTLVARGNIHHDMLVYHPPTDEEVVAATDKKREVSILQRTKQFDEAHEDLKQRWIKIATEEEQIKRIEKELAEVSGHKERQVKISKTAVTAAQRALARKRVDELNRDLEKLRKFEKRHQGRIVEHHKSIRNIEHDIKRVTQVIESLHKISSSRLKERERQERNERHEQGNFTPILLSQGFESPGHHVYGSFHILSEQEKQALVLAGRNARSHNITPILAGKQQQQQLEVEENSSRCCLHPHVPALADMAMQEEHKETFSNTMMTRLWICGGLTHAGEVGSVMKWTGETSIKQRKEKIEREAAHIQQEGDMADGKGQSRPRSATSCVALKGSLEPYTQ
uniref:Uncharacterized protein n=1 Tax=Guillardia theta (strain CCMP2712) TaxID=905079 RepID=A0A0C3SIF9_GUITC